MLKSCHFKTKIEAGTDEAGRGCLAGPVCAAAVILPRNFRNSLLRDSKKLAPAQRAELAMLIREEAISFGVAMVSPQRIDQINILQASIEAMHRALSKLTPQPQHILVDGNRFRDYCNIRHRCVIGGDDLYFSIAAASVLAKEERDRFMKKQAEAYPVYGWESNKGYPTRQHRDALRRFGPSEWHRKSFRLIPGQEQMKLFPE